MDYREKLISVVMPVYNSEKYLDEAIDSILKQTYTNFEFIIIDDGSTDASLDIIKKYASLDERIVMLSRKNRGLVQSLNEGILCARGELVARMDSDDVSKPDRFKIQLEYMLEHPEVFILGSNFDIIFEEGISDECKKKYEGIEARGNQPIDKKNVFLSIVECYKFVHTSIMIRKKLFDLIGLYRDYASEDIELYFRTVSNGLIIDKIDQSLVAYRAREDSKTSVDGRKAQSKGIIEVKLEYLKNSLEDNFKKVKYLIWGADISGEAALEVITNKMSEATCLGFIDPYRVERSCKGFNVFKPDEINKLKFDYVFICTQAGAKPSREYLKGLGKKEVKEYFKMT